MKPVKSAWFTEVADLVLDLIKETRVEVMMQSAITISLNLGYNSVEVDHIAIDIMGVLHMDVIELELSISNRVVGTESGLEFYDEIMPAGHPFLIGLA